MNSESYKTDCRAHSTATNDGEDDVSDFFHTRRRGINLYRFGERLRFIAELIATVSRIERDKIDGDDKLVLSPVHIC